jgi:hypothetical protein
VYGVLILCSTRGEGSGFVDILSTNFDKHARNVAKFLAQEPHCRKIFFAANHILHVAHTCKERSIDKIAAPNKINMAESRQEIA